MTNYSDLIARLREAKDHSRKCGAGIGPKYCVACEAASALEILQYENQRLREAFREILTEPTYSVHFGYDERGNYNYADAVRLDSHGFYLARAALSQEDTPNA